MTRSVGPGIGLSDQSNEIPAKTFLVLEFELWCFCWPFFFTTPVSHVGIIWYGAEV